MVKKYKNYILGIIGILLSLTMYAGVKYLMKPKYEELPEVKLKEEINNKKSFAIMIQNDDGYEKYNSDKWPIDDYKLNEEKTKCIDNNGILIDNAISYDKTAQAIKLETNESISCTLFFDKKTIIDILRENDLNKVLSNEIIGGMYRYQGVGIETAVDDTHKLVDNNYICFGTNDSNICKNNEDKYMYRIIGVTSDNKLYLIKMNGVKAGSETAFAWNPKYKPADCAGVTCEWPQTQLYRRLNGIANSSDGSNIFVNNSIYDYMTASSPWYGIIENHKWLYGDVDFSISEKQLDGETVYGVLNNGIVLWEIETGQKPSQLYNTSLNKYVKHQWSMDKSVNANIGLMYSHDYCLAYDNERNWGTNWDTNNWIYVGNNKNISSRNMGWMITRCGINPGVGYLAGLEHLYGSLAGSYLFDTLAVRPTFYLQPTIKLSSGTGTKTDPYLIKI